MVNLYFETITDEILDVARFISHVQKTTVRIHTLNHVVEVHHEEETAGSEEGNKSERIEAREQPRKEDIT